MNQTPRLASDQLPDECVAVVVGSGFGASVTAARLAPCLPDGQVVVLERGREWTPGEFPKGVGDLRGTTRTKRNPEGLFDFAFGSDIDTLVSCGLGGGSLIYANVLLEPRPEVFVSGWPAAVHSVELAPWFDAVRDMLRPEVWADRDDAEAGGPRVVPGSLGGTADSAGASVAADRRDVLGRAASDREPLSKSRALTALAAARGLTTTKVPVAINLTRPEPINRHGVAQPRCTLCGNCMTGCNVGAKTTLWASYLPVARDAGATLVTQADVESVTPSDRPGMLWRVVGTRYERRGRRLVRKPFEVHCRIVVLGAGALGTTGILLRSRRRGLGLSAQLGKRFSGNGDSLAVAYNSSMRGGGMGAEDQRAPEHLVGPTISEMVDARTADGGHLVQDGAIPFALAGVLRRLLGARFALQRDEKVWCDLRAGGCPPGCGALEHSQVWLAMGSDGAEGQLVLDRRGRPRVRWRSSGRHEVFRDEARDIAFLNKEDEANLVVNPRHALPGRGRASYTPVTVHPLGGAVMADTVSRGVCDQRGRVFTAEGRIHDGLYVSDGSLCPTSTGANPSLTIAALAERNVAKLIETDLARLVATDA